MKRNQSLKFGMRDSLTSKKRVRKLCENWTPERTRSLIRAVQEREELWNALCEDYRNRNLRESLWHEVANEMGMSRFEVTTKWNNLRCSFRTSYIKMEANKNRPGSKFDVCSHYNAMKFLEPSMRNEVRHRTRAKNKESEITLSSSDSLMEADRLLEFVELQSLPEPIAPVVQRCQVETTDNNQYKPPPECTMNTMAASSKSDIWEDFGRYVASSGREWARQDTRLANEYKIAISEVMLEFQKKFLSLSQSAPIYNAAMQRSTTGTTDRFTMSRSNVDKCIEGIDGVHKEIIELKEEICQFED